QMCKRVLRCCAPGAGPAEPAGLTVGVSLSGDGTRPLRPCDGRTVKRNGFIKTAAIVVRAYSPPQRQRAIEQPIPQRQSLGSDRAGATVLGRQFCPNRRRVQNPYWHVACYIAPRLRSARKMRDERGMARRNQAVAEHCLA